MVIGFDMHEEKGLTLATRDPDMMPGDILGSPCAFHV